MVISESEELAKLKSLTALIVNSPRVEFRFDGTSPRESIGEKSREWQTKWTDFLKNLDSGQPLKISNLIVALIEMRTNLKDWELSLRGHTVPSHFPQLKTNIFELSIHLSDYLEARMNRIEKVGGRVKEKLKRWSEQIRYRHA